MKAALYRSHGGPEVLEYAEVPDPVPGPGDVVVRVAAVGLNRLDLLQRQGPGMMPGFSLPHIAGMDVAGEIVATGAGVPASRVGERVVVNPAIACGRCDFCRRGMDHLCGEKAVVGGNRAGGYGALCVVPATHAHHVADHVDLVEAAAMPTVYSLAWHALFETGRLARAEPLVVPPAATGGATAAVRLAARRDHLGDAERVGAVGRQRGKQVEEGGRRDAAMIGVRPRAAQGPRARQRLRASPMTAQAAAAPVISRSTPGHGRFSNVEGGSQSVN